MTTISDDRAKELREWVKRRGYNWNYKDEADLLAILDGYALLQRQHELLRKEIAWYQEKNVEAEAELEWMTENRDHLLAELAKQAPLIQAVMAIPADRFSYWIATRQAGGNQSNLFRAALALKEEKK